MPELQLAAPTAPLPLLHLCLNRAAREFCRQTRAWQEWLEPVAVSGDALAQYDFELPQGAQLLRIERAALDARPVRLLVDNMLPADPSLVARSGTASLVAQRLESFTLAGGPGRLQVFVSLLPTTRASTIPDHLATLYHEALREGAKAHLLNTPGTDYFNSDQAGLSLAFFNAALQDASVDVWRGHTGRLPRARVQWA